MWKFRKWGTNFIGRPEKRKSVFLFHLNNNDNRIGLGLFLCTICVLKKYFTFRIFLLLYDLVLSYVYFDNVYIQKAALAHFLYHLPK